MNPYKSGILSASVFLEDQNDFCLADSQLKWKSILVHFITIDMTSIDLAAEKCLTVYKKTEKSSSKWFPNNLLRNVARKIVGPTWFFLIDVDLRPSPNLYGKLNDFVRSQNLNKMDLYLITVFETDMKNLEIIENKNDLKENYDSGKVRIFHSWCDICYGFYDYSKFFSLPAENLLYAGYEVKYKLSFEPYYLGNTRAVPLHDQRFRGYGYNKVIQCYEASKD